MDVSDIKPRLLSALILTEQEPDVPSSGADLRVYSRLRLRTSHQVIYKE